MLHTRREIAQQPTLWSESLSRVASNLSAFQGLTAGPVVLIGAGTSYYVGRAAAAYMAERAGIKTRAVPASIYRAQPGEAALLISRSGTSTEVLEAAQAARDAGATVGAVTCAADSPLAEMADITFLLDFVKENSVVQTGSATSGLVLLRGLSDALAGRRPPDHLPSELETAMEHPLALPEKVGHMVMLGSGWRYGVACEMALKAQEMCQLWTERYVPLEYRHGPISCATDTTAVFMLDPAGDRLSRLAADVRAVGAGVVLAEYDPCVELVRLQQAALELAAARGLNPDAPRNLTRAVVIN